MAEGVEAGHLDSILAGDAFLAAALLGPIQAGCQDLSAEGIRLNSALWSEVTESNNILTC